MDTESQKLNDMALMQKATETLMEHFDSVQIFVTRCDDTMDGTVGANFGKGDWYARRGVVRDWMLSSDERAKGGGAPPESE